MPQMVMGGTNAPGKLQTTCSIAVRLLIGEAQVKMRL